MKIYSLNITKKLLIIAGIISLLNGSSTGRISGKVYDQSTRSPLIGANIIVLTTELGAAAEEDGSFTIDQVPTGTYMVEASMIGYQPQVKTSVVVQPNRSTELVFMLSESTLEMDGIVVHAEYFPKVKDAPVSERNFSTEEIQAQPGGMGDISRVVQAMPAVVSTGDQDNEIIVRGGNPNENLFLIDGIELPYPNHLNQRGEQGGGINILNSLLVRDVDFIAGAYPARYGDRLSSVTDVSLRRGQTERYGSNIDMSIAGLGVVAEGPLPGNGTFISSYHKSFLDILAQTGLLGLDIVPEYNNYIAKIQYSITSVDEVSVLGLYADDHAAAQPGEGVFDEDYAYDYRTSRLACGLGWQRLFGNTGFGRLLVSGARTQWDSYSQDVIDNVSGDTLDITHALEQTWGARYDMTLRLYSNHELQMGLRGQWIPFSHDVFDKADTVFLYSYDVDSTVVDSSLYLDENGNPVISGPIEQSYDVRSIKLDGYIQHKVRIPHIGYLMVGLRGDYFDYTDKSYISPRAGLVTEPLIAGFSITAGYGVHYQSPQYHILLGDSATNRSLASQRSEHYIVGIERIIDDAFKLTIEGYYKKNQNLHIPEHWTTPDPYDWSGVYIDDGHGHAQGIELFLQKKFHNNWHGTISYSFSEARMVSPQDTLVMIPSTFDYRHVFTMLGARRFEFRTYDWYQNMPKWLKYTIGALFLGDECDIGFRFRFMGGRPYTPMEWRPETRRWVENGDQLNSERLPDYHRLDIRWDHTYAFQNWSLSWYLEIQNVYDRKNLWWYNYKDDGTVEEIHQFRLLPIAGMVVHF